MNDRRTVTALLAALLAAVLALVGSLAEAPLLGVVAAVMALGVGVVVWRQGMTLGSLKSKTAIMADKIARAEGESAVMAARAAKFEAEAISARGELADAMRAEEASPATAVTPAGDGVTDPTTGLFNERFFRVSLVKRVSAARRGLRPLAAVLVEVVSELDSEAPNPADATVVAKGLLDTLRDADTACRLDDGRFGLILEDTPENGAVWTVERVRRRLAEHHPELTLWAGVASYPAHAFDADEILDQAHRALLAAKDWRQDRIEVAIPRDD